MADKRINEKAVLETIYSRRHWRRVVWTPSTTLTAMGIERYPHQPPDNYRQMKAVLRASHWKGYLFLRPRLHSRFTLREEAYEKHPRATRTLDKDSD